jgi:hypothetical protein
MAATWMRLRSSAAANSRWRVSTAAICAAICAVGRLCGSGTGGADGAGWAGVATAAV